ncbi:helix-turn-helix domain-containing protein [Virgibacillus sp. NKC19-3]|uniref:helix-turn-helix transcriptional regulator n=1 Tax=Virgibacillus saliphilus TaxID=2831674 RepID=UPI001C9A6AB2|nr:helix-turn-helix domain-containing protein [Virgibacillus sp. NKC19-3]MBY7143378.1 helix-turn-helix domain-containing protein [Virgibacillus sp. NKC19-3]
MENTLKVTNVLSDPTRYNIYQYIIKYHKEVSVVEIAEEFDIHPNVARLHLSKLEDVNMIVSYAQKTGKGGRPSRLYRLSDEVVELNFPHRDYKLLSTIALESFAELGDPGKQALYTTGEKYGNQIMEQYNTSGASQELNTEQKVKILQDAGTMLGMYPSFVHHADSNRISFQISNCPFKEIASTNHTMVCKMHHAFLKGMFEALFTEVDLIEEDNIFQGCENCTYTAKLSIV